LRRNIFPYIGLEHHTNLIQKADKILQLAYDRNKQGLVPGVDRPIVLSAIII